MDLMIFNEDGSDIFHVCLWGDIFQIPFCNYQLEEYHQFKSFSAYDFVRNSSYINHYKVCRKCCKHPRIAFDRYIMLIPEKCLV